MSELWVNNCCSAIAGMRFQVLAGCCSRSLYPKLFSSYDSFRCTHQPRKDQKFCTLQFERLAGTSDVVAFMFYPQITVVVDIGCRLCLARCFSKRHLSGRHIVFPMSDTLQFVVDLVMRNRRQTEVCRTLKRT